MHRGPVIPIEVELKGGKDEELRATNARDIILTVDSPGPISDVMIFEVDPFTIRALLPIGSINLHTAGTVGIDARRLDLRLS